MKRAGNLFEKMISEENIKLAIAEVNAGHRWLPGHKQNKTVFAVEQNPARYEKELVAVINGIVSGEAHLSKPLCKRRYDKSSRKWRDINEPLLWPDQYVHHALVQVLQPVMMRGMDKFCCGSVRGRGIHYAVKAVKKWMKNDKRGTKYCLELDIHHFYDSLDGKVVMTWLRKIVKDRRVLAVCEEVLSFGVLIGLYTSQWFANTVLQPIDHYIRDSGLCAHYLRNMDNFLILGPNKRKLHKLERGIAERLAARGLKLNKSRQCFPTRARLPTAVGYRYGRGYTLLRKRNLLSLKRSLSTYYKRKRRHEYISWKRAAGLISRLGQLRHCNSANIYRIYYQDGSQRDMKRLIRRHAQKQNNLLCVA